MKISDVYKLFDLVDTNSEEENLVKDIIHTLENYEYLKSRMNKCSCDDSRFIVEGICAACFGVDTTDPKTILFSWKW